MLLIDTMMLIRRCYAKMDFLKNSDGQPTGIEFGTLRTLETLQKKYPDQRIVLCLDSPDSVRKEKFPEYKANRVPVSNEDYWRRLGAFKRFVFAVYHVAGKPGYEADDVMHTLSRTQEGPHYIYTNDHDLIQSVNDDLSVFVLRSYKSQLFTWVEEGVLAKYGLPPEFLPEYFAFVGDKGDNIVGVPRIIKKFLVDLITWAHCEGLSHRQMLDEIKTAAWPAKLGRRVNEFIDDGKWDDNYEMTKLNVLPDVKIIEPEPDDEYVVKKLKEWEIHSLKICKKYDLIDNAEF